MNLQDKIKEMQNKEFYKKVDEFIVTHLKDEDIIDASADGYTSISFSSVDGDNDKEKRELKRLYSDKKTHRYIEKKLGEGFKVTSENVKYKNVLIGTETLHVKLFVSWDKLLNTKHENSNTEIENKCGLNLYLSRLDGVTLRNISDVKLFIEKLEVKFPAMTRSEFKSVLDFVNYKSFTWK